MPLPTVAIVGQPNVGKSSLFNRLTGRPIAIVDPTAGVTRDRLLHEVRRDDLRFDLIDTGGIGIVDAAKLEADVDRQIDRAIDQADLILFVTDGRSGVTAPDQEIAKRLRPLADRVLLIANKIDHLNLESLVPEFAGLGLGDPWAISAEQNRGLDELFEELGRRLPTVAQLDGQVGAADHSGRISICLAGRRNVGKSSITNALCGEDRVIVADHAGTTRDAIDVQLDHPAGSFVLIDTAGLRKKKQLTEDLEFYAACRTERAIGRADVSVLILDATDEVGAVDKRLAHFCQSSGKPTIVAINKWDLAQDHSADPEHYRTWIRNRLPGLAFAPVVLTSAATGQGLDGLLELAAALHQEAGERIPTAELNQLLEAAVQRRRPRKIGSGSTRIYYATQAAVRPPTLVVFVNRTDWMEPGYTRYLENFLRARGIFARVPISVVFKARSSRFHDHHDQHVRKVVATKADRQAHLIIPGKRGRRRPKGPPR